MRIRCRYGWDDDGSRSASVGVTLSLTLVRLRSHSPGRVDPRDASPRASSALCLATAEMPGGARPFTCSSTRALCTCGRSLEIARRQPAHASVGALASVRASRPRRVRRECRVSGVAAAPRAVGLDCSCPLERFASPSPCPSRRELRAPGEHARVVPLARAKQTTRGSSAMTPSAPIANKSQRGRSSGNGPWACEVGPGVREGARCGHRDETPGNRRYPRRRRRAQVAGKQGAGRARGDRSAASTPRLAVRKKIRGRCRSPVGSIVGRVWHALEAPS